MRAGKHAAALGRFGTAVELLERGQALAGKDPELAADLLDALAAALPLAAVVVPADNGARAFALGERLQQALTVVARPAGTPGRRPSRAGQGRRRRRPVGTRPRPDRDGHGDHSAAVDVVKATLLFGLNQLDLLPEARALAERAAATGTRRSSAKPSKCSPGAPEARTSPRPASTSSAGCRSPRQHGLAAWRLRALLELGITDKYLTIGVDTLLAAARPRVGHRRDRDPDRRRPAPGRHLPRARRVRRSPRGTGRVPGEAAEKLGLHALKALAVAIEAGYRGHARRPQGDRQGAGPAA